MKRPCRCLFCGEVVQYDLELSANLNAATGCTSHPSGIHACADEVVNRLVLPDGDLVIQRPPVEVVGTRFGDEIVWHVPDSGQAIEPEPKIARGEG